MFCRMEIKPERGRGSSSPPWWQAAVSMDPPKAKNNVVFRCSKMTDHFDVLFLNCGAFILQLTLCTGPAALSGSKKAFLTLPAVAAPAVMVALAPPWKSKRQQKNANILRSWQLMDCSAVALLEQHAENHQPEAGAVLQQTHTLLPNTDTRSV